MRPIPIPQPHPPRRPTSEQHAGATGDGSVAVASDALVHAEVVRLRAEYGDGEVAVVETRRPHSPAVRQQLLVAIPRHGGPRAADQVHSQRAAIAHVVRLVTDLLLEDRRETWGENDECSSGGGGGVGVVVVVGGGCGGVVVVVV